MSDTLQKDEEFFESLPIGTLIYTRECDNLSPFFVMMKVENDPQSPSAVAVPFVVERDTRQEIYALKFSNLDNALSTSCTTRDGTKINQLATKNILAGIVHFNDIDIVEVGERFLNAAKYAKTNIQEKKNYVLGMYEKQGGKRKNFEQVLLFQHGIEDSGKFTLCLRDVDIRLSDEVMEVFST